MIWIFLSALALAAVAVHWTRTRDAIDVRRHAHLAALRHERGRQFDLNRTDRTASFVTPAELIRIRETLARLEDRLGGLEGRQQLSDPASLAQYDPARERAQLDGARAILEARIRAREEQA